MQKAPVENSASVGPLNAVGSQATEISAEGAPGEAGRTPAEIPCLSVTTAYQQEAEKEDLPLPGHRRKQAEALVENIQWLVGTFGPERVGFLTLTVGDKEFGGRFRNLRDRTEAQRRFHSFLTNVLSNQYQCGVVVSERHKKGGIHFHPVVLTDNDIRGGIDFDACFPPKDHAGKPIRKPDYSTANAAIKKEWAFLRRVCKRYGFGRHQLQPMRTNAEGLGRYLGDYLKKDWLHRWPEDKGARCIRYFGHWSKELRKTGEPLKSPPNGSLRGWTKSRARAWREMVKQAVIVLNYKGAGICEENIKEILSPRWAWKMGKLFPFVRFVAAEWLEPEVRLEISEHNLQVRRRWLDGGGDPAHECWWDVTELTLDHLRASPEWQKQMAELQLAKDCEAEIKRRLKARECKASRKPRKVSDVPKSVLAKPPAKWASWIKRTVKED